MQTAGILLCERSFGCLFKNQTTIIMSEVEMIVWDVQHGNAIYLKSPNERHLVF